MKTSKFLRRKEWRGEISENEPARLTGLIWRGPYSVYEHDFESPWLWGNSYRVFSLPKQWNGGHVGVPKQFFGSWTLPMQTLSLGLCYIICVHQCRSAKWNYTFPPLIYWAESSVGFGRIKKRRGYKTRSRTTAFCSYEKS